MSGDMLPHGAVATAAESGPTLLRGGGLDDQEFVVAFDTDDAGAFLDLVQRLRTTEASAFTLRDTPTFTCVSCSVERALGALDGEPVAAEVVS